VKRLILLVGFVLAISIGSGAAGATPPQPDSATVGGWIVYYDEDWNMVGEWYNRVVAQCRDGVSLESIQRLRISIAVKVVLSRQIAFLSSSMTTVSVRLLTLP